MSSILKFILVFILICQIKLLFSQNYKIDGIIITAKDIKTGADQTEVYLPLLKNKQIGIVSNQTSLIGKTHLIDSLLSLKINIKNLRFY